MTPMDKKIGHVRKIMTATGLNVEVVYNAADDDSMDSEIAIGAPGQPAEFGIQLTGVNECALNRYDYNDDDRLVGMTDLGEYPNVAAAARSIMRGAWAADGDLDHCEGELAGSILRSAFDASLRYDPERGTGDAPDST